MGEHTFNCREMYNKKKGRKQAKKSDTEELVLAIKRGAPREYRAERAFGKKFKLYHLGVLSQNVLAFELTSFFK